MLNHLKIFLLSLFVLVLCACHRQDVRQIPVLDFFKTPEKSYYKISPDGKYISYLKPYKEKQNLFIQSLADGKEVMLTSFNDYPVKDYFWTYNNQIVLSQDIVAEDQFKMFALDVATMKLRDILSLGKVQLRMLNRSRINPDIVTVALNKRDPANFDVYRLNIRTGELKMYIQNPGNFTWWFPDQDGKIRLVKSSDGVNEAILYRKDDNVPFRPIIVNNFKNQVQPIGFTADKKVFYALSNIGRDKSALVEINAETGKEEKTLYSSDDSDIQDWGYSKKESKIEYAAWNDEKPQIHFLNSGAEHIYNDLIQQLPGNEVKVADRDSAEVKFIIYSSNDRNPGSYYLYQSNTKKLTKLADINASIKPDELCAMQPISYKASDGLTINGYLTLPKGNKKTNLPVVVLLHNGPWTRTTWGYNAEMQFLANRGYAVFQVNYRGSVGYGKAFYSAGFKQVGGKMQQDITDGVHWLIDQKIANPKKIAIFGSGFGGFCALYGMSFHPELYNCGVVQYGLINFFNYIKDAPPFFKPKLKMTYEMVGNPETDADALRAISPVFHPDKFKSPLIIFQGAKDPRANISELNQFVRELKRHNVPVTYVLKENERTYFRSEHNRTQMYQQIEEFLANNMKVKQ
ncbi:alpha/beta hydrolase family protein [Mucilaginibacter sp. KACC 22063]|uniref:alpha/beta hydrolase family protein n=1 Tax=Mucilaginibacter sp. KACC 22063 TaxID=3025666 RepID=UPI0023662419|nr:prolyl oligopeptidase family serine peptidase [Mucilaginibacter sp. KACC 22063]WDF54910.1 prolyl oligopeptidase family serine peptidase [Mucilaginibacter sp. KACC 22063]